MNEFAVMPLTDYVNSCDKIREKTNTTENIKSGEIPEKINDVYDVGVIAGKKSQYDEFWDVYQDNGRRTDYSHAFAGYGWTNESFKPKYDIVMAGSSSVYMLFRNSKISGDLTQILEDNGVEMDFSRVTGWVQYVFGYSEITRVGKIDFSSATMLDNIFSGGEKLHTIDELILPATTGFNNTFTRCTSLENLTISGVIGQNGLNLQWSTKLSKASIESIINALSATTSGLAVTLSKTAVNNAFETSAGAADGLTSEEWLNLIATKSNWTINLLDT